MATSSVVSVPTWYDNILNYTKTFCDILIRVSSENYVDLINDKFSVVSEEGNSFSAVNIRIKRADCVAPLLGLKLELIIFNSVSKTLEADYFNEDCKKFISTLSVYGRRHTLCPGLSRHDVGHDLFRNMALQEVKYPNFHHFRHKKCEQYFSRRNQKYSPVSLCSACNSHKLATKYYVNKKRKVNDKDRTSASSTVPFAKLTEKEEIIRRGNILKKKNEAQSKLNQLTKKIQKETGMALNDDQSREMKELTDYITNHRSADLAEVLQECKTEEQRILLRQIWDNERKAQHSKDMQAFKEDQQKNKTGVKSNTWSSITYRIALAIYLRCPSAYTALKSFHILQLPSLSSVRDLARSQLQGPGPHWDRLKKHAKLYDELATEKSLLGVPAPTKEGVLIFDEVKITSKVAWNTHSGEIIGLEMPQSGFQILLDVCNDLESQQKPAQYVLQFYWRDLSSSFDILGPYFTSATCFNSVTIIEYLFSTLRCFEAAGFHVRGALCDGAPCNLAVIKATTGQEESAIICDYSSDFTPKFENPFWPDHEIYWMICPSHQLKNMVNALFSSRENGSKEFRYCGVKFGWKSIVQVYTQDVDRARQHLPRRVPKLSQSFIARDSWTKLNVFPAKIMQQEQMLSALLEISQGSLTDTQAAYEYLNACSQIFENGLLGKSRVTSTDKNVLDVMKEGMLFFTNWREDVQDFYEAIKNESIFDEGDESIFDEGDEGYDLCNPRQKRFLSWQTWTLLVIMMKGFQGICDSFLTDHPENYVYPARLNGSAVETVFSQVKDRAGGKVTGLNYSPILKTLEIKNDVHGAYRRLENDYRNVPLSIARESFLKPSKKRRKKE